MRRDAGKWIGNPQDVYERIADVLSENQVQQSELWWADDMPQLSFVLHKKQVALEPNCKFSVAVANCCLLRLQADQQQCKTRNKTLGTFECLISIYCTVL